MSDAGKSRELGDILLDLGARNLLQEALDQALRDHPEHRQAILRFALEWRSSDLTGEEPASSDEPLPAPDLSRLWSGAPQEFADPFQGKSPQELRAVASLCDVPTSIMMKLSQRLVDAASIPFCLLRDLAAHLATTTGELVRYLEREQTLAHADYRSMKPPEIGAKMTFAEAIRSTPMSEHQRTKWLELCE